jgi:hypothetical protein
MMKLQTVFENDLIRAHHEDNTHTAEVALEEFLAGYIESHHGDAKWWPHLINLIDNDVNATNIEAFLKNFLPSQSELTVERDAIEKGRGEYQHIQDNAEHIIDAMNDGHKVKLSIIKKQLESEYNWLKKYEMSYKEYEQDYEAPKGPNDWD